MTDSRLDAPATKRDLQHFATKEDLQKFATKKDLEKFATKEDLEKFVTKEDLQKALTAYATKDDLSSLESRMETKLDTLADMIRALGMKMDEFQKERVYRDEVQDLENRVKRVEEHTGLR